MDWLPSALLRRITIYIQRPRLIGNRKPRRLPRSALTSSSIIILKHSIYSHEVVLYSSQSRGLEGYPNSIATHRDAISPTQCLKSTGPSRWTRSRSWPSSSFPSTSMTFMPVARMNSTLSRATEMHTKGEQLTARLTLKSVAQNFKHNCKRQNLIKCVQACYTPSCPAKCQPSRYFDPIVWMEHRVADWPCGECHAEAGWRTRRD